MSEDSRVPGARRGPGDGGSASGPVRWIDNHCHLGPEAGSRRWGDSETMLSDARAAGVVGFVDVAVDLDSAVGCLARARSHPDVWATAGVHPHSASNGTDGLEAWLREHGGAEVVAVGECGLDYHYDNSPRTTQRHVFAHQVSLANSFGMPLVIHCREAWEDTFEILDTEGVPERTVFHCFTGGTAEATEALARGALLSVSGIVTFASAGELAAAVRSAPLDRLMVETDTPYLAPVPHRGEPNRPALVSHVGAEVARLKDLGVHEVSAATLATTRAFYGIAAPADAGGIAAPADAGGSDGDRGGRGRRGGG